MSSMLCPKEIKSRPGRLLTYCMHGPRIAILGETLSSSDASGPFFLLGHSFLPMSSSRPQDDGGLMRDSNWLRGRAAFPFALFPCRPKVGAGGRRRFLQHQLEECIVLFCVLKKNVYLCLEKRKT